MAKRDVIELISKHSSLQGVLARSRSSRMVWALIITLALAMCCLQMSEILCRYFAYGKKTSTEVIQTPVPFPSISICNMRNLDFYTLHKLNVKFKESSDAKQLVNDSDPFVMEYMRLVAKFSDLWYEYQRDYPDVFMEIFSRTTISANIDHQIISDAAILLNEYLVNCYKAGNDCHRTEDFTQFFNSYYFNCFTYTRPEDQTGEAASTLSEGIDSGWSATLLTGNGILEGNKELRIIPGIFEPKSPMAGSEGVRVVLHPPGSQPFPLTEGFDVPSGFSASFGLRLRMNNRLGTPFGDCEEIGGDFHNMSRYRSLSCQRRFIQQQIVARCNCSDITLPRLSGADVPFCRSSKGMTGECSTGLEDSGVCLENILEMYGNIQCARSVRKMVSENATMLRDCSCYPPCHEILYDVTYSLSRWPASGFEGDAAYHQIFLVEKFVDRFLNTSKHDMVAAYFRGEDVKREDVMSDFTRLNVYIADNQVVRTEESPAYGSDQLVSDIGGLLGLWVGISLLSLAEALELLIQVAKHCFRRRGDEHSINEKQTSLNSEL